MIMIMVIIKTIVLILTVNNTDKLDYKAANDNEKIVMMKT